MKCTKNGKLTTDQPLLNSGNSERELIFPKDSVYFNKTKFPNGTYSPSKPDRVELLDTITIENGYSKTDFRLKGEFKWTQDFLNEELNKGTKFIIKSDVLSVRFIREEEGYKRPTNFIKEKYTNPLINKKENGVGTNENASSELKELMGTDLFSYPKPVTLMTYLTNFVVQENDIVLDFFSGSSSTAEGVLKLASTEEKKLKYIMVQLPENLDDNIKSADSNTKKLIQNGIDFLDSLGKPHYLTELAKERIRRAAKKIKEETKANIDYGFRVYKLDSSNMQDVYYTPNQLSQDLLSDLEDNIKPDRTADDLVAQIILDWGLPLSLKIEQTKIANKEVFKVDEDALLCCFDEGIDEAFAKEIAKLKPLRIVFRDKSFKDDTAKENVKQLLKQLSPESEMKVI